MFIFFPLIRPFWTEAIVRRQWELLVMLRISGQSIDKAHYGKIKLSFADSGKVHGHLTKIDKARVWPRDPSASHLASPKFEFTCFSRFIIWTFTFSLRIFNSSQGKGNTLFVNIIIFLEILAVECIVAVNWTLSFDNKLSSR